MIATNFNRQASQVDPCKEIEKDSGTKKALLSVNASVLGKGYSIQILIRDRKSHKSGALNYAEQN